jgi:aminopeptidase-like protein
LANDNLSGVAVSTYLAELLAAQQRRYSYRFLFVPGTIGAIAWLTRNRERVAFIRHGLVLTGIGNDSGFHYKKSRRGNVEIDKAMSVVLRDNGEPHKIIDFYPYGYDERQYCSPGFNLPVGCLMRSVWGTFPEYHTSADNMDFIKPQRLAESLRLCAALVDVLENNRRYRNLLPYCEPQLGKRGLYRSTGGTAIEAEIDALLWVLNFSDGDHSLLDISAKSGLSFATLWDAVRRLQEAGMLAEIREEEKDRELETVTARVTEIAPR